MITSAGADRGSTGAAISAKSVCPRAANPGMTPMQTTIANLNHWLCNFKNIKDLSLFIHSPTAASQNSRSPDAAPPPRKSGMARFAPVFNLPHPHALRHPQFVASGAPREEL
jgi:hypothetical protein